MFSWLPLVLAGIAGLLALFYKNQAENSKASAIEAETKIKDAPLVAKQLEDEKKIKEIENQDDSKLTPEQRAKRWDT